MIEQLFFDTDCLSSGDILVAALAAGLIDEDIGNKIWSDMIAKHRQLPVDSFSDYLKKIQK
jgi:hypothetical protein